MLLPSTALAANFTVNSTDDDGDFDSSDGQCDADSVPGPPFKCTLRAAFQQAQADNEDLTVTLPDGVYPAPGLFDMHLTINGGSEAGTQIVGALSVAGDLTMSQVTVRDSPGTQAISVAQKATLTHVTVKNSGTCGIGAGDGSVLSNVTVSGSAGCGIAYGGSVTINDSTIRDNGGAGLLGAISIGTQLTMTNVTVSGNEQGGIDGGFGNRQTLSNVTVSGNQNTGGTAVAGISGSELALSNVTVTNNTVTGGSTNTAASGIAIIAAGDAVTSTLDRVTISRNTGATGLLVSGSRIQVTVTGSTISGTTGGTFGGVMIESGATVTMQDSAVTGSRASDTGAGIRNGGTLTLTNVTVSGNQTTASKGGGGIHNFVTGRLTITGGSISTNSAPDNGGLLNLGDLTMTNVSVLNNSANLAGGAGGVTLQGATPTVRITGGKISNNTGTGLRILDGGTPQVDGVTFADNSESGLDIDGSGTKLITKATITGNDNVGVVVLGGTLDLRDSTISGNSGTQVGGGVAIVQGATATISNTTISDNHAVNGAFGGGIANAGTLTLTDVTVRDNDAAGGGGGTINDQDASGAPTLSLTDVTIDGNQATDGGGGIENNGGNITIRRSAITTNTGTFGGGLKHELPGGSSAQVSLENVTFSANSATVTGGAIAAVSALSLTNVTVAGNSAPGQSPGGIATTAGLVTARNTIVGDNRGGDCATSGPLASAGHNLFTNQDCGPRLSLGDVVAVSARLGPLANNGGPTQTMAVLVGSPAVDAGDANGCPATDQRGVSRPQGTGCDIGAFESSLRAGPPSCDDRP